MAWQKEFVNGYETNVYKPKSIFDEAFDHLDESYSTRMGHLCQPRKLKLNLRSVVKCRKTERKERLARKTENPFYAKQPDYEEEPYYEDDSGYNEQFYEEEPQQESIFKKSPKRRSGRGLGPAPRKPGLWR